MSDTAVAEPIVELLADLDHDSVQTDDPRRWTRRGRPLSPAELERVCEATTEEFSAAGWLAQSRAEAARDALAWLKANVVARRAGAEPWERVVGRLSATDVETATALVDIVADHVARYLPGMGFGRSWETAKVEIGRLRHALHRAKA